MIEDLLRLPEGTRLDCDVCVVGSGAAGLAIADEFFGATTKVIVLESGGPDHEAPTQELYQTVNTGLPFFGAHGGRFRVFGGSTTRWGGQALPLSPFDFEPRPWVPHSGWPIRYDDVAPYYPRAARFMCVDGWNYDTDLFERLGVKVPDLDARAIRYHFSKWSPTPDLRRVYVRRLRRCPNLTVLFHANVVRIGLDAGGGAVRDLTVRALGGKSATVRARHFVLCAGGIETARLLLACNDQEPLGVGNRHGLVGRFFQDHPAGIVGELRADNPRRVQRLFNLFHRGRQKYAVRLSATRGLQERMKILAVSGAVMFVAAPDSPFAAMKEAYHLFRRREFNRALARNLGRVVSHPAVVARPVFEYAVKRRTYSPGARFMVTLISEQAPNPDSRITLAAEKDALGMPRARVHWQLTDLTRKTFRAYADVLKEQFRLAGAGELEVEKWLTDGSADWQSHVGDQCHHMGTTRMSERPEIGVVDGRCRVHGIENLYVGSSSVFPTCGHSNPTLTLIALSIRIADDLKRQLAANTSDPTPLGRGATC